MRLHYIMLALGLCIALSLDSIQPQDSKSASPDKITFGSVEIRLGMKRQNISNELMKSGYLLKDWGGDIVSVESKLPGTETQDHVGNLSFKDSRLVSASKDWLPNGNDGVTVADAIYGALSAFRKEGRTNCEVLTEFNQSPKPEVKEVKLFCKPGQKHISIVAVHGQLQSAGVFEILE